MTASGQGAAKAPGSSGGAAGRPRSSGLGNRAAMLRIGMAATAHMLRSRRTYQRVALIAVGAVALARIGKESQDSTLQRLSAWDKRQIERLEHKAKAALPGPE
jgi:hypothetical protein